MELAKATPLMTQEEVMVGTHDKTFHVSAPASMLLQVINSITEYQIPLARRHSKMVAAFSLNLTDIEVLNFDKSKLQLLWYAALLHDIGKLCLPLDIWNYPRSLTKAEFDLVKTHPTIGFEILNTLEISEEVKQGVLHHHERWDGSGYPDGLQGDAIPLFAQIIAAADVFDALTNRRTYREAFSELDAKRIMQEKPYKFNPAIIENIELLNDDPNLIAKILPI